MKVLALFDGISIGRLALDMLNIKTDTYHAFEVDTSAIAVSRFHYPDIIQHGDVTQIDYRQFKDISLLIGGSPCQDLSQYNQVRLGLEGTKSNLFYYYVEALKKCKPEYFFFENVGNLRKADEDILNEIFESEPQVICSSTVSGQTRKRNYWTNLGPAQIEPLEVNAQEALLDGVAPRDTYTAVCCSGESSDSAKHIQRIESGWAKQLVFVPDEKGEYVHGEVPYGDCYFKNLEYGKRYRTRRPYAIELERLQTIPDDYTKYGIRNNKVVEIGYWARHKMIGNAWTTEVIKAFFRNLL